MSISDTKQAQKYASIAETAAAQATAAVQDALKAPEYANEAAASAEEAEGAAQQAIQAAGNAASNATTQINDQLAEQKEEFDADQVERKNSFDADQSARDEEFNSDQQKRKEEFSSDQSSRSELFSTQITSQKIEFEQFLLNSGYQFIGSYEDGTLTFSARNQYTLYNNQYYRLNSSTGVGFITTGVSEASFANDVAHFVLIDGDTLRQNLSSNDGYKYIGRCSDVATLKATEPSVNGQKIELACYRKGGNIFDGSGGNLFYDSTDTTSEDNGITIFVTAEGKRWKRENYTKEINLAWGGLEDGDEIATIWQTAINLAIAETRKTNTTADTPIIKIMGGTYALSSPITHPPFVRSVAYGDVFIQSNLTGNTRAISVKGVAGFSPKYNTAHPVFSSVGGAFDLSGLGRNVEPSSMGLVIGNDATNNNGANGTGTAGCTVKNFRCSNFGSTLGFTGYDAYLTAFHDCAFGLTRSHIKTLDTSYRNSGERISFYNVTLWGGGEDGFLNINTPQFDFQFISGSWDYSAGDYIVTGKSAGWSTVIIDAVHMEGVEGKIVNSASASAGNVAILFQKSDFLPTGTYGSKVSNSPSRKLFALPDDGSVTVEIDNLSVRNTALPNADDILMSNSRYVRANSLWRTIYPVIPGPAHIKNRGYNFTDEADGAVFNSANPLARFTYNSSGGGLTAKVGALPDGSKCLALTVANNLANISFSTMEFMPVDLMRKYCMSCAVQYLSNTKVNVNHRFQWYDKDLNLISSQDYLYFLTTAMNDTSMDNYSLGGNREMPSFAPYRNPPSGAAYLRATAIVSQLSSDANITNFMVGEI